MIFKLNQKPSFKNSNNGTMDFSFVNPKTGKYQLNLKNVQEGRNH